MNFRFCRCGRVAFRARTPARSGPGPGPESTAGPPSQRPPGRRPAPGPTPPAVPGPVGTGPPAPSTPGQAPRRPARHRRGSADPGDSVGDRQRQPTAGISRGQLPRTSCFSSSDTRGCRRLPERYHALSRGKRPAVDRGVDWASGIPSAASAVGAIAGVISAAHAPVAPERAYGKEEVHGSIP